MLPVGQDVVDIVGYQSTVIRIELFEAVCSNVVDQQPGVVCSYIEQAVSGLV